MSDEELDIDEVLDTMNKNLSLLQDTSKEMDLEDIRQHLINVISNIYFLYALLKTNPPKNGINQMYL